MTRTSNNLKATAVRVDLATHERLKALARGADMSLTDLLRTLSHADQAVLLRLAELRGASADGPRSWHRENSDSP